MDGPVYLDNHIAQSRYIIFSIFLNFLLEQFNRITEEHISLDILHLENESIFKKFQMGDLADDCFRNLTVSIHVNRFLIFHITRTVSFVLSNLSYITVTQFMHQY